MAIWQATQQCYVEGVELKPGQKIGLTEEVEKKLKLGKFQEEAPDQRAIRRDPESKKKVKVGFMHLKMVKREKIDDEDEGVIDGMVLYPPPPQKYDAIGTSR